VYTHAHTHRRDSTQRVQQFSVTRYTNNRQSLFFISIFFILVLQIEAACKTIRKVKLRCFIFVFHHDFYSYNVFLYLVNIYRCKNNVQLSALWRLKFEICFGGKFSLRIFFGTENLKSHRCVVKCHWSPRTLTFETFLLALVHTKLNCDTKLNCVWSSQTRETSYV